MAVRDFESKSTLDSYPRRATPERENRRSAQSSNRNRLLHRQSLGYRRYQTRRRRLLTPHWPVAPAGGIGRRALVDGTGRSKTNRRRQMDDAADPRAQAVQERRPGFRENLLARRRRPSKPHVSRAAGLHQRPALLASKSA